MQIYGVVCRVVIFLMIRFIGMVFWMVGFLFFEFVVVVVSWIEEKKKISGYIKQVNEFFGEQSERDEFVFFFMWVGLSKFFLI